MRSFPRPSACLLCLLCAVAPITYAKPKHPAADRQDDIEVLAHLPLTGTEPVTRFVETRHYRHEYLYAEYESSRHITLIDITAPAHPTVISEIPLSSVTGEHLVSVVGNAGLVNARPSPADEDPLRASGTYRIMSFVEPAHPVIKEEFRGVTAIALDDKRGLIFIANKDGIWVLQQKFAMSPEDEALQKSIERSIYETP